MLLETLLLSPCFLHEKSTLADSKTKLHIDKKSLADDEVLLVFDIDDQSEHKNCNLGDKGSPHRSKIRQLFWGKEENHGLCDFLVFYAKGSNTRVFCFVDLKDNKADVKDATGQVISTYEAFKSKLKDEFNGRYKAYAFICSSNGSLPQSSNYQNELKAKFADYEHDGTSENFLNFLRGETPKFQKKGQKRK